MAKFGRTYADLLHQYRWIILIVIVALLIVGISGNKVKVGPLEFGTEADKVDTSEGGSRNINGGQHNINGNNNVNVSNNGDTFIIPTTAAKNQNEYSITGTANARLIKRLEKSNTVIIVPNSEKIIDISFTGSVMPYDGNMYYYSGGNVVLVIDGICYNEFKEFKIDQMRPSTKKLLVEQIDKEVNVYIETNIELFSQKILECIRK